MRPNETFVGHGICSGCLGHLPIAGLGLLLQVWCLTMFVKRTRASLGGRIKLIEWNYTILKAQIPN